MNRDRQEQSSEEFSTSAELRSYIENNLKDQNSEVYPHAGLVDDSNVHDFMSFMESAYEGKHSDMPHFFKNTQMGKIMKKKSATRTATNAVQEGNISQMKFISGKQSYTNDISGIHTLIDLRNKLGKDAYIQYLFGHMGNGKTDFAILQAEISHIEHNTDVATNIKSLAEEREHVTYIPQYGDLLQWLADGAKVKSIDQIAELEIDVQDKLFIFDEASSHASGYSDDAYETQKKLGTLVKKIRKVGGNLIIIGHTGKDVHPDIRRITNDCVSKSSLKTAEYYHAVNEQGNGEGHKETISGIPQTNWNGYDTNEITSWDWSDVPLDEEMDVIEAKEEQEISKEKRDMRILKAVVENEHPKIDTNEKGEITGEMIGEHYGITPQRVSQIIKEYEEKAQEAKA
ncbi:putative NTPase [Haloarcula virus Hardyhisp2]|uniref:Putative NTPase n=1 Tax=Haloarcula virus Hardyhisp2 TaxID=2811386 RepID=A0A898KC81_9VIRU|nr:putative NTPase [Haloarcula virus Hardyhisp2]QSJ05051.1 putative NTPase [Haloarcula virus Hardyhisp2]